VQRPRYLAEGTGASALYLETRTPAWKQRAEPPLIVSAIKSCQRFPYVYTSHVTPKREALAATTAPQTTPEIIEHAHREGGGDDEDDTQPVTEL
jgi:hypothetical protein